MILGVTLKNHILGIPNKNPGIVVYPWHPPGNLKKDSLICEYVAKIMIYFITEPHNLLSFYAHTIFFVNFAACLEIAEVVFGHRYRPSPKI